MGATKANDYNAAELQLSILARAVAHPARVKIIYELYDDLFGMRNIDLADILNFSRPTVKSHIDMLKDADLIEVEYFIHYYRIRLNKKGRAYAEILFNQLSKQIS